MHICVYSKIYEYFGAVDFRCLSQNFWHLLASGLDSILSYFLLIHATIYRVYSLVIYLMIEFLNYIDLLAMTFWT